MALLRRHSRRPAAGYRWSPGVTIRWGTDDDARAVAVLAELDDARVPSAPLLLAFVGDELWVAASLETGAVITHPFRPSAEVAALALQRGRQLVVPEVGRPRPGLMRVGGRLPETG